MKARLPKGVGGGPGNMQSMIKQAQQMQEEMGKLQEELDVREYTVTAGGGAVTAVVERTAGEAALYEALGRAYREQRRYQTQLRKGAYLA